MRWNCGKHTHISHFSILVELNVNSNFLFGNKINNHTRFSHISVISLKLFCAKNSLRKQYDRPWHYHLTYIHSTFLSFARCLWHFWILEFLIKKLLICSALETISLAVIISTKYGKWFFAFRFIQSNFRFLAPFVSVF